MDAGRTSLTAALLRQAVRVRRLLCGFALILLALAAMPGAVRAGAECRRVALDIASRPVIAHVVATTPRLPFVKAADEDPGCPAAGPRCEKRAYVIAGDLVAHDDTPISGFVCATYVNAKGRATSGWLPLHALRPQAPPHDSPRDWLGSWFAHDYAEITIVEGAAGKLHITGSATYGADDPRRVAIGGVNLGDIAFEATPRSGIVALPDNADQPAEGDGYDCAVRMQRFGPYLLVQDNMHCGGNNVTFQGIYARF
jgi:hypothetical protein